MDSCRFTLEDEFLCRGLYRTVSGHFAAAAVAVGERAVREVCLVVGHRKTPR